MMRDCLKATVIEGTRDPVRCARLSSNVNISVVKKIASGLDVRYNRKVIGCNWAPNERDWRYRCTLCGQADPTKTCHIYRQPELGGWWKQWGSKIGQEWCLRRRTRRRKSFDAPYDPTRPIDPDTIQSLVCRTTISLRRIPHLSRSTQSRADTRWESYNCACLALAPLPARAYR